MENEEQAAPEMAVTKEEFQDEWTVSVPEFTAVQPEAADWSKGIQVSLCLNHRGLHFTSHCSATEWSQTTTK